MMLREDHPPIWRLIASLKKSEALSIKKISDYENGLKQRKKTKYITLTQNLNRIMLKYDPEDKIKTLKAIANILKVDTHMDLPQEEES